VLSKVLRFGLFAAVCISLTVYIGATIANVQTGSTYHLSATFGDVTGLGAGDPVKLAGVPVGQVTSVKLVVGQALVGMAIKTSVKVPSDTQVAVRWRNLIGQRYLSLVPGRSPTMLAPGSHITNTTSVVDLGAVVNELGPLVGQISPQQLDDVFTSLDQALNGNEGNADALVADLNGVLATLAQRNGTISQLLTDYKTITGTLATRDSQIGTMVDNLALLSQAFADNTQLLDSSLTQLSGLSTGLDQLLTTSGSQLKTVVDNLSVLTGILHARVGSLEDALHNLPPALQALFAATSRGGFLDVDLVCLSTTVTCTYPIYLAPPAPSASGVAASGVAASGVAASAGPVPLDTAAAFRRLIL
jgi:phospholipid/cholesterol/gamma-HCH transport system substrate-binding protein